MFRRIPKGFTLVELMITVAVISIIVAVALPFYRDYMESARIAVLSDNIQTIRLMQDERRLDLGEYVEGVYDPTPRGARTLSARLGWDPRKNRDVVRYEVACITDGATAGEGARNSGYSVTATHIETGDQVSTNFSPTP